jgi:hypothetical protein
MSKKRPSKVAVCLSGQLRTFKTAAPGILRYFERLQPDYFIHTWTHNTWRGKDADKRLDLAPSPIPDKEFKRLLKFYKPVRHIIEPYKEFFYEVGQSQQYSNLKSMSLRQQHEQEQGFKYDIVVKCRPDVIWNSVEVFPFSTIKDNAFYASHVDRTTNPNYHYTFDRVYFGSSNTMDAVADLYYKTATLVQYKLLGGGLSPYIMPEEGLHKWLEEQGIQTEMIGHHEIIVRRDAEGLDHLDDLAQIKQIHRDFYS